MLNVKIIIYIQYSYINIIILTFNIKINVQLFDYQLNENVHLIKECEYLKEEVYIISF